MDPQIFGTATEIGLTLVPDAEVGSPHTSVASVGVDEVRKEKEGEFNCLVMVGCTVGKRVSVPC